MSCLEVFNGLASVIDTLSYTIGLNGYNFILAIIIINLLLFLKRFLLPEIQSVYIDRPCVRN